MRPYFLAQRVKNQSVTAVSRPSSTSYTPVRNAVGCRTSDVIPLSQVVWLSAWNPVGGVPSANKRLPVPTTTGNTITWYSSISPVPCRVCSNP